MITKDIKIGIALIAVVSITVIFSLTVYARPQYAVKEGKACGFCHINPAGGGPRNPVGQFYAKNGYKFPPDFDSEKFLKGETAAKTVDISLDIRNAYVKSMEVSPSSGTSPSCRSCHTSVDTFLLMQGEVTVSAKPSDKLTLVASNNMGAPLDLYATMDAMPELMYLKVGQFEIPFGLKQKDHNILTKQGYNITSNQRDVGIEVGGIYSSLFYNAAVFNGNRSAALTADNNQHKAFVLTAGGRYKFLRAGVSYLIDKPDKVRQMRASAFLTASYSQFFLEGEYDIGGEFGSGENWPLTEEDITSKGYYVGAGYKINPKLNFALRYGLFDPSRQIKGDASQRMTLMGKYEFTKNASLQLIYWLNIENKDRLKDKLIADKNVLWQLKGNDQLILMSHFWF